LVLGPPLLIVGDAWGCIGPDVVQVHATVVGATVSWKREVLHIDGTAATLVKADAGSDRGPMSPGFDVPLSVRPTPCVDVVSAADDSR
jgi:hypothetical protein